MTKINIKVSYVIIIIAVLQIVFYVFSSTALDGGDLQRKLLFLYLSLDVCIIVKFFNPFSKKCVTIKDDNEENSKEDKFLSAFVTVLLITSPVQLFFLAMIIN